MMATSSGRSNAGPVQPFGRLARLVELPRGLRGDAVAPRAAFLLLSGPDQSAAQDAVGVFGQSRRVPPPHPIERLDDRGGVAQRRQLAPRPLQSLLVLAGDLRAGLLEHVQNRPYFLHALACFVHGGFERALAAGRRTCGPRGRAGCARCPSALCRRAFDGRSSKDMSAFDPARQMPPSRRA